MANPIKALRNQSRRKARQVQIMGKKGTHRQEREQLAAENRARIDPTARGKAAIKRVGEYKRAEALKIVKSDGTNTYLNRRKQENLK
jgi:hypothetical protein